ncbi:DUF2637 domain-containing protein [Kitasatospora kifunensis]|uniref:DUF2637 domain-containing protein n=1 Tax=Kitasatospora kifunensis TaxID=58351 RepID=UPI001FE7E71E|nr:DUF2637 domain-containing protein [Kitasatospora kifunensis]
MLSRPDPRVRSAERALSAGTWTITAGAVLYSVLTVTPLAAGHTPKGWEWTAPILPLVADAAVVIVVRMDSILATLEGDGGRWPDVLRWMTGLMTLLLNVGLSALHHDLVGVAVHSVAPLLLIVTAETSLAYRRAIRAALSARETAERAERAERDRQAQERREREREERLAERERADRSERERRDHEAKLAREEREHTARLAREDREAADRREAAERDERFRREAEERDERGRREREMSECERREREEREARERQERERAEQMREWLLTGPPATERIAEERAREAARLAFMAGLPQRLAVERTGWSTGWIAARYKEAAGDPATVDKVLAEIGASAGEEN